MFILKQNHEPDIINQSRFNEKSKSQSNFQMFHHLFIGENSLTESVSD